MQKQGQMDSGKKTNIQWQEETVLFFKRRVYLVLLHCFDSVCSKLAMHSTGLPSHKVCTGASWEMSSPEGKAGGRKADE